MVRILAALFARFRVALFEMIGVAGVAAALGARFGAWVAVLVVAAAALVKSIEWDLDDGPPSAGEP